MSDYQQYISKIFINSDQARDQIDALRKKIKDYQQDKQNALNAGGKAGDKAWKEAEKNIRAAETQIKRLSTTSEQIDHVLSNLSTARPKELQQTIKAINKELTSGSIPRNTEMWNAMQEQLRRVKTELKGIQAESAAAVKLDGGNIFTKGWDALNKNWGAITQVWGAFTGLSQTIRQTTQAYSDMEEELANVRKYTGQSADEVERMNEDFKKIDTRTSREELNQLAGAAGRLGIQSTEQIEEFVDAADKIGVALGDDLGDGAVDKIGKLAMAFGEDDRKGLRRAMLATGSAINELAQNSSANAGYLVEFTARLAGVGQQAGLTQAQIMGFGTVLDENMQKDEMAATALSKIISVLATDSSKLAKVAGLDAGTFAKDVKEDMNNALIKFFEALNKKGGLVDLAPMFADMGLDGSRAASVLSVMAQKIEDVKEKQALANKAYEEGTSVGKEFEVQNNTVQAGIDKNRKAFHDLAVELGQQLMPIVKYTISTGSLLVKTLSTLITFTSRHRNTVISITTAIVAYTAMMKASVTMDKLKVLWNGYVIKGLRTLYTVMMRNPYLAAAAAVMTAVAAYKDWRDSLVQVSSAQQDLHEVNEQAAGDAKAEQENLRALYREATDKANSDAVRKQAIKELNDISPEYLGWLNSENIATQNAKKAVDAYTSAILLQAKAKRLAAKIEEVDEKKRNAKGDLSQYTRWYDGIQTGINSVADKLERGKNALSGFLSTGSWDGWDEKTSIDGYALNTTQAAMIRYYKSVKDIEDEEKSLRTELKATNKQLLENKATYEKTTETPQNTEPSPSTPYKTDKQRKAEEKARKKEQQEQKKAAAAAIRAKRDADKTEKADLNTKLTALAAEYAAGNKTYQQFLDERERLQLESIKKRKAIWGEGSNEAKQLADDELNARQKHADALKKMDEQEIERERVLTEARLKVQYYDKNSEIYLNEDALNEALFKNDMDALDRRIDSEAKGSEEWLQLVAEKERSMEEHRLSNEIAYQERLAQYREEWGTKSAEEQEAIALNGLNTLHDKHLLSEEEYQKMLLNIKRQYASQQAEADAEEKGPGSNTRKWNEDINTMMNKARARAGDAADPENDNAFDVLFGNDLKNWQNMSQTIASMEEEGVLTHAQANAMKADNDSEYLNGLVEKMQAAYSVINTVVSAASAYSQACADLETAKIEAEYDRQIEAAGNNSSKKEKLEKERDKKIAAAKTKANKKAMVMELAQAVAQTAMGAISAYTSTMAGAPYPANLVLAPVSAGIATAAGMLQIATIKKQHEAEQAGYYVGGFTPGRNYRRQAGVVHEGEFVANHSAVNNAAILPALQLIDQAQRNNTVASLTGEDVSRALGTGGGTAVVAPVVNVQTDNAELNRAIGDVTAVVDSLNAILSHGISAKVGLDGPDGLDAQYRRYKRLKGN